ncbi:ROK family transcriptional regulator [Enterococcus sp. JM9B]|uniref:ROK family transcriptional regulator n=1 Tax=Enterococcus sp. JM9B TaxID=1857216 RepID=UPI001375023C|nr:ROK family transcriptional regulator [Enterococcus sp. JM9B]KAF1303949.1 MarR family transcriptional regulator [Enterococcus sp. JM9B]
MISTKYTIREHNEANILNTIIRKKEISRAEVAQQTGLNKASVSAITKKLLDDQLIFETRVGDASNVGGRKPIMLTFNRKSSLVIAFDLGYNYIEGMLAFIDGTVVDTISKRRITVTAATIFNEMKQIIDHFIEIQPPTPHGIVGLTAAIHGLVKQEKIIFTPYYDLDQSTFIEELQKNYDFPIFIQNEANLAALGEYTFTSQYQNLVSISVHSGIGAGIVTSGKLQQGKHGQAGEIGHSILYPNGRECPCGNHGCLEQYASNKVTYDQFGKLKNLDYVNSEILLRYVEKQDTEALAAIQQNAALLSVGINNIIMMYDPEIVVINSSLYRRIPQMVNLVTEELKSRFSESVIIRNTLLEDKATLYGAFAVSAQNFLNIQKLKLI